MRLLLAVLALGVGAALPTNAPAESAGSTQSLERLIDAEMPASGVPGLSYAVVEDGEVTSVGSRGVVELGRDTPVTPDTPFLTGSISKSFTALSVMQLVEAGRIDLDAEVSDYLDGFSGRPAGAVTIRQLLGHTSGFSTLQGNASRPDDASPDALERRVTRVATTAPAHEPGSGWEYSNTNYEVLGRVVEVVSGQDYQTYVTDHVLEPIGMAHSFVADGEVHESMATGHRPWFGTKRPLPESRPSRGTAPQGGLVASAGDLARYLDTMMDGRDDVLSVAGKTRMMRPASPAAPFYGFGWFVDPERGTVWHSGASPGYESLAMMLPAERKGVVVLVNGGSGVGFGETSRLRNGLAATALGLEDDDEGSRLPQKALFVALLLLPLGYLVSMVWAWRHRTEIRAKSGAFGVVSIWLPVLTTLVAAWVMLLLVPNQLGSPLGTIMLFQPDLALVLVASAATGILWAGFRLGVAYTGRAGTDRGAGRRHRALEPTGEVTGAP